MLSFSHLFIGAAVGTLTNNPALGFGLGVVSHHLADAVPHVDTGVETFEQRENVGLGTYLFAAVEGLVGAAALEYVLRQSGLTLFDPTSPLALGAFGGVFPDLVDNIPLWKTRFRATKVGRVYHDFHDWFHTTLFRKEYRWWPLGVVVQIFIVGLCIVILRAQ